MNLAVNVISFGNRQFSMRGTCPHCGASSAFLQVGCVHNSPSGFQSVSPMQCQACMKFILTIVTVSPHNQSIAYNEHYPLGKPSDAVAHEIPDPIRPDFKEALRCLWVDAYNATVEMCRRALEASCLNLGAPKKKVLEDMIDWLEAQRKITPALKEAAHKIRLGGNRGAHPSPEEAPQVNPLVAPTTADDSPAPSGDGPVTRIEKEHAEAVVEFTRHFFEYVYVMPKALGKYDFSKPKVPQP
jgi:hypothetical protein